MNLNEVFVDDDRPIFVQIADMLEEQILDGTLPEEARVPSTNELAAFHRINPATAGKGLNKLVDEGIVYKRRGIGMFVATGSREELLDRRRRRFAEQFVAPLITEARNLGISIDDIEKMIRTLEER